MVLKFITLNVEHGGRNIENILQFVQRERPDILFFQEVYNSENTTLEKKFRALQVYSRSFEEFLPYYDFRGIAFDPVVKGDMGNAIFSKYPLSNTGVKFFDVAYTEVNFTGKHDPPTVPRAVQFGDIEINGQTISLFNLHGIWANYGGDDDRRIEMAEVLENLMKDKENKILAGDTNFTIEAQKTVEIIERSDVKSVFGNSLRSTFNMAYKSNPAYATAAVDMIFVSPGFTVLKKEMPDADLSDHYPLYAELEFTAVEGLK